MLEQDPYLQEAPRDKYFYFQNGSFAVTISDLVDMLSNISESEFFKHVNSEKNDFAEWIGGVFLEKWLAEELRKERTLDGTLLVLESYAKRNRGMKEMVSDLQDQPAGQTDDGDVPIPSAKETTLPFYKHLRHKTHQGLEKIKKTARKRDVRQLEYPEFRRFLIKDFLYGFFFGILLGILLGTLL